MKTLKFTLGAWGGSLRRMVRRIFCKHALAWVRNIHADEIILTGCRTVWICEKCGKVVYDRDYITRDMAVKVYSPNDEVSDRRAHGNENTTGANGGSLH